MDNGPPNNKFGLNPFNSYRYYEVVSADTILREWRTLRLAAFCLLSCSRPDILAYVNEFKTFAASEGYHVVSITNTTLN